ncbi:hypothetical protein [Citrobacter freundii]|uniref:hypothetical protein n=1 Tax=Citrobacter freundii TaxID=546 RepID=UPI0028C32236|nr:hypothetical protein [Citrobacter freundii]MDT7393443.1 hypothetical protein [Citrobacter freundii]MDT7398655.1 hypothetical protein [Citrobacter freundii]
MTTNNHPAHGPVSLDRLHQISETLSKAAAQSDGGNIGYAMADAVKVIDGAIAAFGAEPAPVDIEMLATVLRNAPLAPSDSQGKPRAPVVPDEDPRDAFERTFKMPKHVTRCGTGYAVTAYSAWLAHDFVRMWEGWNACRAAMLQGADGTLTNEGTITATQFKPVADLYGLTSPTGGETSFTFDAVEARDFIDGGWSCQEYVELERFQEAVSGNSPVIPDGWVIVPAEPTAEMLQSGISAHYERNQIQIHDRPAPGPMECAYVAMLAAAPQQEVK